MQAALFCSFFIFLQIYQILANGYKLLFEDLIGRKYNKLGSPIRTPNDTIHIEFKFRLTQIVDVLEREQVITTKGWLLHVWKDERLSWDPFEYGNITKMHFPGEMVWLPDVILYNNAHGSPSVSSITHVIVTFDGTVTWQPAVKYDSFCPIDIEWYPYALSFDLQKCELKFGSWSHSGLQLDIIHPRTDDVILENDGKESVWRVTRGVDLAEFQESVEFDLLSVEGIRHEKWYSCCDYPFIDITYYLVIRRKKLFYTVYMILPCACIAALTGWVYYLPCESNEKNTLCISTLVALTFYFLMLVEIIPPTSLVTPFIVKYLNFTLLMTALSIVLTVFSQEVHHRRADQPMHPRIRQIFINWLGKKLLISRKTEMANYHRQALHNKARQVNALSAMSILERQFQKTLFDIEMSTKSKPNMPNLNSLLMELPLMSRSKSFKPVSSPPVKPSTRVRRLLSTDLGPAAEDLVKPEITVDAPRGSISEERRPSALPPDPVRDRLRRAEKNVHFIAQTLTERRRKEEAKADWMFVSQVIDRILLIVFNVVLSAGTLAAMLSAFSVTDDREPLNRFSHLHNRTVFL